MTISNVSLSAKAAGLIKTFSSKEAGYQKAKTSLLDELIATGWTSAHLRSPKTTGLCTPEAWAELNRAVAMTLPKSTFALWEADTAKGMTEAQKFKRTGAQRQIGSLIKDLRNSMIRREPKESRPVTAPSERHLKSLQNMVTWIDEIDGEPAGKAFDVVEIKSQLNKLMALMKG